jgi:hypothetical protein
MIKFVSVTASKVASKSSNVGGAETGTGDEQKQQELNANLQEFKEETAAAPDNDQLDW